jgi:hypothetical protein
LNRPLSAQIAERFGIGPCFPSDKEARMQGENEQVRDTTEGSVEEPAITRRDERNPVGQDSSESEYGGEVDQPARYGCGNAPDTQGEGFILQQGSGSDDLQQDESASSAKATEGTDSAAQGRGAPEDEDEASSEGGVG